MVCTLAGFDHEYIRKKAQTFFERQSNDEKICDVCNGNGFVRVPYEEAREEVWATVMFATIKVR